jgi:glycosyltransferase involved in cell wall biosynthesis
MTITLITPTADQPMGMALAEYYMERQTVLFDQWIVVDDGIQSAKLTMGQQHIIRQREHEGGRSLSSNILSALPHAMGDVVIIIEHDDYYAPDHIETCLRHLDSGAMAAGSGILRYFNVQHRLWRVMGNRGSALCNTAFTRDAVPYMQSAAQRAFEQNVIGVDNQFWTLMTENKFPVSIHDDNTVVGIKGLPGRIGLGIGHRPDPRQWIADPAMKKLREWIGDDVQFYQDI